MKTNLKFGIIAAIVSVAIISTAYNLRSVEQDDVTVGLKIGNKAPELKYKNPEGKIIALSSLKGKMVLIDFWASWCMPCRMENPNLVQTYKEFKDTKFKNGKGFTIYGVSLDRFKNNWENAIKQDSLVWDSHVSDLKFWSSEAAQIYQVHSIPTNFLIDGDGIIIAKGLRGNSLRKKLKEFEK